jgi:hypothetical protein
MVGSRKRSAVNSRCKHPQLCTRPVRRSLPRTMMLFASGQEQAQYHKICPYGSRPACLTTINRVKTLPDSINEAPVPVLPAAIGQGLLGCNKSRVRFLVSHPASSPIVPRTVRARASSTNSDLCDRAQRDGLSIPAVHSPSQSSHSSTFHQSPSPSNTSVIGPPLLYWYRSTPDDV